MKRLFFLALAATLSSVGLHAQAVDTTVCDVLKDPVSFNGKIVRIKGTVVAGFDQFVIRDNSCGKKLNAIWLSLPEGTKAKAGPALMIQLQPAANFAGTADTDQRTPVTLDKNKDFKQFDSQLSATYKSFALCLGCNRNEVSATLVGRLDGVIPEIKRNAKGQIVSLHGFGNLNMYSARLVLQSVSEVSSKEVNYSKSSAVTHDEMPTPYNGGDGFGAAHKAGQAFASNNPGVAAKIERAELPVHRNRML